MTYRASVITGRGEGKSIGFPTINLTIPDHFSEKYGIYAGWVFWKERKEMAVFHYGPIPLFEIKEPSLEAHLVDITVETPPPLLSFTFEAFLREVMPFQNKEELREHIERDITETRTILDPSSEN